MTPLHFLQRQLPLGDLHCSRCYDHQQRLELPCFAEIESQHENIYFLPICGEQSGEDANGLVETIFLLGFEFRASST